LAKKSADVQEEAIAHYEALQFSLALESIWSLVAATDQFLTESRPWVLAKDESKTQELSDILNAAAQTLRHIAALAFPVVPHASEKIWLALGNKSKLEFEQIDTLAWGALPSGSHIGEPEAIFPRVDKKEASERIEAMEEEIRNPGSAAASSPASAPAAAAAPAAAVPAPAADAKIAIEDFAKVQMRVGVVKTAERIQGADKILKLTVDIGDEVRQIVAGLAVSYQPEELVGKKVVVVVNLAPRKLRGVESNGMIVAASVGPEGKPVLCTFAEDVPAGAKLK
jgi:methionyl-tRNA synthetase